MCIYRSTIAVLVLLNTQLTFPQADDYVNSPEARFHTSQSKSANESLSTFLQLWADQGIAGKPLVNRNGDGSIKFLASSTNVDLPIPATLLTTSPSDLALKYVRHFSPIFGVASTSVDFRVGRMVETSTTISVRLSQFYDSLKFFGAEINVLINRETGGVRAVFCDIQRNTFAMDSGSVSLSPQISMEQALATGAAELKREESSQFASKDHSSINPATKDSEADLKATLSILGPQVLGLSDDVSLVWLVRPASASESSQNGGVIVDAVSGTVDIPLPTHRDVLYREIYDSQFTESTSPPTASVLIEGGSPTSSTMVNRNYAGLGQAHDFFLTTFGWDSYNNAGAPLNSFVNWVNLGHASWDPTLFQFTFGTGGYAEADDIIGHEFTHAVQQAVWNPLYVGESAAIAESISDLYGELIDWSGGWDTDNPEDRWQIGETLDGGPLRDMSQPDDFEQPEWIGSPFYNQDILDPSYAHNNSSVGSKFWYLLVDGGTFNGVVVDGIGEVELRALLWETISLNLVNAADYQDLYFASRLSAQSRYSISTSPSLNMVLANIDAAARAVGIEADLNTVPIQKLVGVKELTVWEGTLTVPKVRWEYFDDKEIRYRVYAPDEGFVDPYGGVNARTTKEWPLDVIILSHGAGMNRFIASGYDADFDGEIDREGAGVDDVEGLATYWARHGYIVVAPTHVPRFRNIFDQYGWSHPLDTDNPYRFVADLLDAGSTRGPLNAIDRMYDLVSIEEALDTIINVGNKVGAYDPGVSKIGVAGHSLGAYTTFLMSGGRELRANSTSSFLSPENNGIYRRYGEGTETIDDDHGPYIKADSFLYLSGSFSDVEYSEMTTADLSYVNLAGQNLVEAPSMQITAETDPLATPGSYFDTVTKSVGLSKYPSYGICVDGANHLTSVVVFDSNNNLDVLSWNPVFIAIYEFLLRQLLTPDQLTEYQDPTINADIQTKIGQLFTGVATTKASERERLGVFKKYSLKFWDAYLSEGYDQEAAVEYLDPKEFGDIEEDFIAEIAARPPTTAFIIRDDSEMPIAQLQSDGNLLLLKGNVTYHTFAEPTSFNEFMINLDFEPLGVDNPVLLLNSNSGNLNLDILPALYVDDIDTIPSPTESEFLIMDGTDVKMVLDAAGRLHLKGGIFDADILK